MMIGEPSGTAGSPILKIVLEKGLSNVLVVVTRYFGGILLGTGGLVRAYSEATIKALEKAKIVNKKKGYKVKIVTAYDQIEQFNYYVNKNKLKVINTEYLENIEFMVEMAEEQLNEITNNNSKNPLKIIKYDILKEKYEEILKIDNVVGLFIATRCDSITEETLDYLEELNKRTFLVIELGLQTIHEKTSKLINRGHTLKEFDDMVKKLRKRKYIV